MRGIEIGSNINGKYLDDPDLWPFYEKAQRLGTFIFVHPINVAGLERMQKYHLRNLIGNPLDTSLAIASIIFGGVLESFPRLKFCFAHAGGFTPYQQGRLERGYHVRSECKTISKPPIEYIKLLYFDTITHYAPALSYLIETVGSDHVLMGSDYPFDMGDPNPVSTVKDLKTISNPEKRKVLGKNAIRLLNLSPKG
jgi:aminocarboxymuconate-semialdehyde decarboxylase